jgi:hypothetical protein
MSFAETYTPNKDCRLDKIVDGGDNIISSDPRRLFLLDLAHVAFKATFPVRRVYFKDEAVKQSPIGEERKLQSKRLLNDYTWRM